MTLGSKKRLHPSFSLTKISKNLGENSRTVLSYWYGYTLACYSAYILTHSVPRTSLLVLDPEWDKMT